MFLAGVLSKYEEEVICDLAEYYNIYDYKSHPKQRVAIFVKGLSQNSRTMKKIAETNYTITEILLASILDNINILLWSKTKDGQKNRNKPEAITRQMLGDKTKHKNDDLQTFDSSKDFEILRKELIKRIEEGGKNVGD